MHTILVRDWSIDVCFFFFQAEGGIRDGHVTGVQTCALPISKRPRATRRSASRALASPPGTSAYYNPLQIAQAYDWPSIRSEERRVGKECRCRVGNDDVKEKGKSGKEQQS